MTRPMLERLRVENYGCIKKADFVLSPLHALIGPNDSGKSTVLRALRTVSLLAEGNLAWQSKEGANLFTALIANANSSSVRLIAEASGRAWEVEVLRQTELYENLFNVGQDRGARENAMRLEPLNGSTFLRVNEAVLSSQLKGSQVLRLEPDELRKPSGLIPDGLPLRFANEQGGGLPGIYDAVLTRDLNAFISINDVLRGLFPVVKTVSLKNISGTEKSLGVQLVDGTFVGAEFMSEGLLYYLAYAALGHVARTAMLLIEEPENGLHPARIADVMRTLREVSKNTQVIIATHSPLVINELEGHEVSVVTRTVEGGTQVKLMKDTKDFEERSKVYSLGELWLSYADGNEESALLNGGPRP